MVRALGIMLLLAGCINSYNAAYFNSTEYNRLAEANQDDLPFLAGTAHCNDVSRVCMDKNCTHVRGSWTVGTASSPGSGVTRNSFVDDQVDDLDDGNIFGSRDRNSGEILFRTTDKDFDFDSAVNASRTVFVSEDAPGHRRCELRQYLGAVDLVVCAVVVIFLLAMGRQFDEEADDLDEKEQTAQDYVSPFF